MKTVRCNTARECYDAFCVGNIAEIATDLEITVVSAAEIVVIDDAKPRITLWGGENIRITALNSSQPYIITWQLPYRPG